MSRSDLRWFFKSLFKLSLNCVLLIPRVESFFKGFVILILVHASTEFSKHIWGILILFLLRTWMPKRRSDHLQYLQPGIPWSSIEKDEREEGRRPSKGGSNRSWSARVICACSLAPSPQAQEIFPPLVWRQVCRPRRSFLHYSRSLFPITSTN